MTRGNALRQLRILVLLATASLMAAPEPEQQQADQTIRNPYTSEEDVAAGGRLYRSHCAVCHGIEGEGGRGVDLTTGRFRHGSSDSRLFTTISEGIPGTEMPGIFFNGRQMWQLVAFVRSLSAGRAAEQITGDPAKGEAVYAANGCAVCHQIRGEGGSLGPDLTDIGAIRSMGHLQAAILEPDADVLPQHWIAKVTPERGRQITGLRMNEDTFSIQLRDAAGRLRSFRKAELEAVEVDRSSAMPTFEGRIQGEDFDNLIAYLATLRLGGPNDEQQ